MAKNSKRRGNGEGSIFKRDGKWKGSVTLGKDSNGKIVRKQVTGETRKEVQDKMDELKAGKRDGFIPSSDLVTVEDTIRRWLRSKRGSVEETTLIDYTDKAERYVIPHVGLVETETLQAEHVDQMLDALHDADYSPRIQQYAYSVLKMALNDAVRKRRLRFNVCDWVDPPRVPKREHITLSEDQLKSFLQALSEERMRALFIVMAQTGIRVCEALALQWDAVDLDNGEILIKRSLVELGGKTHIKPYGKTKSSSRRIKLSALAEMALTDHKARMFEEGREADTWVFCNADGEHLRRRAVNQWLKRILKNAGLPQLPLKNLRHTAATVLLGRKWPLKTVADLLGHSSIQQTADTYGQFTEGIHGGAVADLSDAMTPTLDRI
ncbi:site-specific integrase [Planctomycetaceae bacterium]|nr:site-specific integrase [Planctomycetaceae bacterium]